ncbi:MAG: response regulator transcription factor [SAR202 cluster bacterium]|nr:response regulator transcription factor [SAR202 cluster bacterium]
MAERVTVIIADDHKLVRDGIRAFLSTQPDIDIVGEATHGEEAVRMARERVPDVVLMDLSMPVMDGIAATQRVRQVSPRTQVVVLTSFHDDSHVFPAIQAGALSFLLKSVGPSEVADAVRAAARGEAVLHPAVAARLVRELRGEKSAKVNPYSELTERDQEVLRFIAEGRTNGNIAAALVISEKTVKGHVSNVLGKLHLADRTQAAVYAWREGFVRKE